MPHVDSYKYVKRREWKDGGYSGRSLSCARWDLFGRSIAGWEEEVDNCQIIEWDAAARQAIATRGEMIDASPTSAV